MIAKIRLTPREKKDLEELETTEDIEQYLIALAEERGLFLPEETSPISTRPVTLH